MLVKEARAFATARHKGQLYGNGRPYMYHLTQVAGLLEQLGYPEEIIAAGWLHDTVEDTATTIDEVVAEFGATIAAIVDGVTYADTEKDREIDKIDKATSNPASWVVKFADASVNFSNSVLNGAPTGKDPRSIIVNRYGFYLRRLQVNLPTPEEVQLWLDKQNQE